MHKHLFVLALVAGCWRPPTNYCGVNSKNEDTFCPEGLTCDIVNDRCLTNEQAAACRGLQDGDLCTADGRSSRCSAGSCLPACGDGVLDDGEECDGNIDSLGFDVADRSHDGCSSTCKLETLAWQKWQSPWRHRDGHSAAYDSGYDNGRGRLVLFGGRDDAILDDSWARQEPGVGATTWSRLPTTLGPSARSTVMAYDFLRGVTVAFGGSANGEFFGDTWELIGSTWSQKLVNGPAPRTGHAMVFDAARGKIVLFGGTVASGVVVHETWTYDGEWSEITEASAPSASIDAAMAYDPKRRKVVLLSGDGFGTIAATWELGSATNQWIKIAGPQPLVRQHAAMAYVADSSDIGSIILFGGSSVGIPDEVIYGDTWKYDGTWTQLPLTDQPSHRRFHTMTTVPDPEQVGASKIVLVGGSDFESKSNEAWELQAGAERWEKTSEPSVPRAGANAATINRDGNMTLFGRERRIWTFDGSQWQPGDFFQNGPVERTSYAMAYDTKRDALIMHGGFSIFLGVLGDTWEFANGNPQKITNAGDPSTRYGAVAAYDPVRQVIVMFGGLYFDNGTGTSKLLDETWEFDGRWHLRSPMQSPPPQKDAAMAFDPVRARIVLLADGTTWTYDGNWVKLVHAENMQLPRNRASMTFDPRRKRLLVFGGRSAATLFGGPYELTEKGWQLIKVANGEQPSLRQQASVAYVESVHSLVIFSGGGFGPDLSDTWSLAYRSATPDEVCTDGQDNDGDRKIDKADPDCQPSQ
jgi:hypothetical protein